MYIYDGNMWKIGSIKHSNFPHISMILSDSQQICVLNKYIYIYIHIYVKQVGDS